MSAGSAVKLFSRTSPFTPCTPAMAPRQIRCSSRLAKTALRSGRRFFGFAGGGGGFLFWLCLGGGLLLGRLGFRGRGRRSSAACGGFAFGRLGRLELAALGARHRLHRRLADLAPLSHAGLRQEQ